MLISGAWELDDDGITRPYVQAHIRRGDGQWQRIEFLVDSGADQTVVTSSDALSLGLPIEQPVDALHGFGGSGSIVKLDTVIRFVREDGTDVTMNGPFAGAVTSSALDSNVLGRDVLNNFAVIIDRPNRVVAMLHAPHRYSIESV